MSDWLTLHARPVVDSIVYSLVGTAILVAFFWIISRFLPFSMKKEIEEDQNVALGIILGAFIIGISLIVSTAIK